MTEILRDSAFEERVKFSSRDAIARHFKHTFPDARIYFTPEWFILEDSNEKVEIRKSRRADLVVLEDDGYGDSHAITILNTNIRFLHHPYGYLTKEEFKNSLRSLAKSTLQFQATYKWLVYGGGSVGLFDDECNYSGQAGNLGLLSLDLGNPAEATPLLKQRAERFLHENLYQLSAYYSRTHIADIQKMNK